MKKVANRLINSKRIDIQKIIYSLPLSENISNEYGVISDIKTVELRISHNHYPLFITLFKSSTIGCVVCFHQIDDIVLPFHADSSVCEELISFCTTFVFDTEHDSTGFVVESIIAQVEINLDIHFIWKKH